MKLLNQSMIILSAALSMGFCSCNDSEDSPITNEQGREYFEAIPLTIEQKGIVESQNDAAFKLFKAVNNASKEDNVFFSPLSFSIDLSMIANGATDETLTQIKDILGVSDLSLDEVNKLSRLMLEELPIADRQTKLSLANGIWVNKGVELKKDFKTTVQDYYEATIKSAELSTDKTRKEINNWASKATNGLIPEFLETNLSPEISSIILNALYFNGRWDDVFNKNLTKESDFKTANGATIKVPMMKKSCRNVFYDNGETMKGMRLRYGNGSYYMTVIKPYEGVSVDKVIETLTRESYTSLKNSSKIADITLTMPRYKINSEISFKDILPNMGYDKIFGVEYPLMASSKSILTEVKQKTSISVDEEGAEAAAVTGGLMVGSPEPDMIEYPKVTLNLDSPFIFLIEETSTGSILFIGKVSHP
ncbi:MAG: serpin family protein [Muribaculaceae bacterium]|nr:serpin family protein [Muribaculaceae bacterium]